MEKNTCRYVVNGKKNVWEDVLFLHNTKQNPMKFIPAFS